MVKITKRTKKIEIRVSEAEYEELFQRKTKEGFLTWFNVQHQ